MDNFLLFRSLQGFNFVTIKEQEDIEFIEKSKSDPTFKRAFQLKERLDIVKDNYDYIIIDCPPSLGNITTNALTASNSVIIPVQCEFFALEGIMQLLNSIMLAQKN